MKKKLAIILTALSLLVIPGVAVYAAGGDNLDEYTGVVDEKYERENDPLYAKYHDLNSVQQNDNNTILFSASSKIQWGKGLTHDAAHTNTKKYYGVDVSKWQGKIDWKKVKAAGVDFAIIRLGYRAQASGKNTLDPYFKTNIEGAHAQGIKVGVYFYTQAIKESEAKSEADFCAENLEEYKSYIDFPVMYDIENTADDRMGKAKLNTEKRTKFCVAFCKEIEEKGYKGGVYSYKAYFDGKLTMADIDPYYFIWLAEWKKSPTYTGKYGMWQYSDGNKKNDKIISITVPGISGAVDLDVAYENVPEKVKGLKYTSSTDKAVSVSWTKQKRADGYQVRVYDKNKKLLATKNVTGGSATVEGLPSGAELNVYVRAYFYFENSESYAYGDNSKGITIYTHPAKVSGIKMSKTTKNSVTLKWGKTAGASEYTVYKYDSKTKKYTKLGTTKNTSYTIKNLSVGKKYSYAVMATKKVGEDAYHGSKSVVFQAATKTAKVSSIKSGTVKTTSAAVSWAKQTGVTGYQVFCYDNKNKLVAKVETTKTSLTQKELKSAAVYSFKVRSFIRTSSDATAFGDFSSILKLKTYPTKVEGLMVSKVGANSITFKWNKVSGAAGYTIYQYNPSTKKTVKLTTTKKTSYTWKKLADTAKYSIKVVAYTEFNKKQLNASASSAVAAYTKPAKVTGLKISGGNKSTSITLKWKAVKKAGAYRIYRYNAAGKLINTVDVKKNSYTFKKLDAGSYKFKVRALLKTADYESLGDYSDQKISYVIPGKITGVTATEITSSQAKITWNETKGVEGYLIMMYDVATGSYKQIASVKGNSYVMRDLVADTNYQIKVVGYINHDKKLKKGSYSDVLSFATLAEEPAEEE